MTGTFQRRVATGLSYFPPLSPSPALAQLRIQAALWTLSKGPLQTLHPIWIQVSLAICLKQRHRVGYLLREAQINLLIYCLHAVIGWESKQGSIESSGNCSMFKNCTWWRLNSVLYNQFIVQSYAYSQVQWDCSLIMKYNPAAGTEICKCWFFYKFTRKLQALGVWGVIYLHPGTPLNIQHTLKISIPGTEGLIYLFP